MPRLRPYDDAPVTAAVPRFRAGGGEGVPRLKPYDDAPVTAAVPRCRAGGGGEVSQLGSYDDAPVTAAVRCSRAGVLCRSLGWRVVPGQSSPLPFPLPAGGLRLHNLRWIR